MRNMAVFARRMMPRLSGFRLQDAPPGSDVVELNDVRSSANAVDDEVLAAADSLAILLTRCRKTVRIALNDVSAKIKQPDRTCKDLIRNGFFENNAISGWSVMGESVKTAVNDGVLFLSGREK